MEGVDSGDHYTASYLFVKAKGYIKMFFWLLEVSIVNSYLCLGLGSKQ